MLKETDRALRNAVLKCHIIQGIDSNEVKLFPGIGRKVDLLATVPFYCNVILTGRKPPLVLTLVPDEARI